MAATHKLETLLSYYRQGGIGEVLLRLSAYGYLPPSLFSLSKCHLFALEGINPRALSRPLRGYHFERGDGAVIDELVACQGNRPETRRSLFEQFFAAGADCYVSRHDGELVAYFWGFTGSYRLRFSANPRHTLMFALNEHDVFFGNGYIAPAHRLRGIFPHLVDFVASHYPDGRRFSSVNHTNLGSLQAHHRLGFVPLGIASCLEVATVRTYYRVADSSGPRKPLAIGPTTIGIDAYLREPELALLRLGRQRRLRASNEEKTTPVAGARS